MKTFKLTEEELKSLRRAHRSEGSKHAAYKLNAVILLGSAWTLTEVKEALLLDDETLRSYVKKYQEGGVEALVETHYLGRLRDLNTEQLELLVEELESKIYLTTSGVIEYVKEKWGESYTPSGMRDLLHGLDYEFKKPKLVPGNPDVEKQGLFAEQYEEYMLEKPGDIEVFFADAVHPEHNTMAGYGWIKRGEKRELKTNAGRERLNLHGALNAETLEMTVIESKTVNADSTITLLETLKQRYPLSRELKVIVDNAGYHYSKDVKAYLKENPRIQLIFLPPYSPELNLIERVWKFFKKKVLYNHYYETLKGFRLAAIQFFRNIGRYRSELESLLSGGFEGVYT